MKRFSILPVLTALLLIGCQKSAEVDNVMNVSTEKIEVDADGATRTVTIDSKCEWVANCSAEWVVISPESADAGTRELSVTVAENSSQNSRTASIDIKNENYGISRRITVAQRAFEPFITVSRDNVSLPVSGGSNTVSVESNVAWSAESQADWLDISPSTGVAGTCEVTITASENAVAESRTATVIFRNSEYGITEEVTVVQTRFEPYIKVSGTDISFPVSGGSNTVGVESNIAWSAESQADWLDISPSTGGAGTCEVTITASENAVTESRTATVIFRNSEYGIAEEVTVVQTRFEPYIKVSGTDISFPVSGGSNTVSVESNIAWSAESQADWIKVVSDAAKGTVYVTVTANNTVLDRTAEISLKGVFYDVAATITVEQESASPFLTVLDKEIEVNADFSSGDWATDYANFHVNSNIPFELSCEASWITIPKKEYDGGANSVRINADDNMDASSVDRSAQITVSNDTYGIKTSVLVIQKAPYLNFEVDNHYVELPATGGSFPFTVSGNVGYQLSSITVPPTPSNLSLSVQSSVDETTGKMVYTATALQNYTSDEWTFMLRIRAIDYPDALPPIGDTIRVVVLGK